MIIGKRLKDLRLSKGLNQQQIGEMLGVTKVSICGYENGTRTPSLETFLMIAELFGVTTDYLLGREVEIKDEETNEHIGNISKDDVEIIKELKNCETLYNRIIKDPKRYVSLINKKMK